MRPPKFIPTCDSILIPNVASTLQWKRRRIRRVAWYAEDDFNVDATLSLSCHVSCADFFRRRALFLPLTRRPCFLRRGDTPPRGVFVAWCNIRTFVRLCFGVSCGIARARSFVCDHVRPSCPSCPSWSRRGRGRAVAWPSCPGRRDAPGCGRGAAWPWLWCPLSLCRRRVVATRRRMLVFAMVLVVSVLSWFAI